METRFAASDDDMRATLRNLVAQSEALLAALGDEGAQRYRDTVAALQDQIRRAQDNLGDLHYTATRRARVAARRADQYVHENPWSTAGGAAAVGAAIGALVALLIARR